MSRLEMRSKNASRRSRRQPGQSLAEMAIAIPVLVFLVLGGFDSSLLLVDKVSSGFAVRQGARLAAELGGSQTNPNASTWQIDNQIVRNVLAVSQGMTAVQVNEIDVYAPRRSDGVYSPGDPLDQYFISAGGGISAGVATFPISNRNQTPPNETSIGVRLLWTYNSPAGVLPRNMQLSDYAVMKAAPILV
jgi:TadE-like protein